MLKTIKFVICWLLVLLIRHSVKAELYPVQLWENLVGDATNSYNSGRILTLEENNVIALAYKSGYTYLIRYNANGDTLWTKSLHFNGTSIQQASDQGFIIVGSHGTIYDNLLICRTDANGDTLWTKIYNSPDIGPDATFDHSIANDVQIEDNGDLIIIGERYYQFQRPTSSSVTLPSMWLLKTDPDGDTIWTKLFFNGTTYSKAINIYPAPGGGFSVIGSKCYYDVTTGNGPSFVWYLQLNSEGDTILSKEYSIHSETSYIASISGTPTFDAGNAIGYYTNFDSSLFVLRMNADGDTVWSKKIAFNPDIPNAITVRQTPDSGLVICYGYRKNNYLSPFVIRMNRNGDILWSNIFDDCFSTSSKGKSDIVPLSDHCFILSGTSTWTFSEVARPAVWLCKIEESAPPVVLESVANDNVVENSGIDIDDYILITFGNHRCLKNARFRKYYTISSDDIDSLLPLSNGHSWLSGEGILGAVTWNGDSSKLVITLSTIGGAPTISIGDTVTFSATGQNIHLTGSFGPVNTVLRQNRLEFHNSLEVVSTGVFINIICSVAENDHAVLHIYNCRGEELSAHSLTNPGQNQFVNIADRYRTGIYIAELKFSHSSKLVKKFIVRK